MTTDTNIRRPLPQYRVAITREEETALRHVALDRGRRPSQLLGDLVRELIAREQKTTTRKGKA